LAGVAAGVMFGLSGILSFIAPPHRALGTFGDYPIEVVVVLAFALTLVAIAGLNDVTGLAPANSALISVALKNKPNSLSEPAPQKIQPMGLLGRRLQPPWTYLRTPSHTNFGQHPSGEVRRHPLLRASVKEKRSVLPAPRYLISHKSPTPASVRCVPRGLRCDADVGTLFRERVRHPRERLLWSESPPHLHAHQEGRRVHDGYPHHEASQVSTG